MSVSFKCIQTGNVFTFIYPVDIATTRENPAFEEIVDGLQTKEKQDTKEEVKKPRKTKGTE